MKIAEGVNSLLQMAGLLARLCQKTVAPVASRRNEADSSHGASGWSRWGRGSPPPHLLHPDPVHLLTLKSRICPQRGPRLKTHLGDGRDGLVKNPSANAGDARNQSSIPGWGRSPEEGNGSPLQYSFLDKSPEPGSLVGCSP